MELSVFSILYTVVCLIIIYLLSQKLRIKLISNRYVNVKLAPSPKSLPIIGHLHLLAKFPDEPWKGFDLIRKQFGDIVSLKLGYYDTVMVSSIESMKEVLTTKGKIFADRPHFYRYTLIFGGDQENALALCNWSKLQNTRRNLCSISTIPKFGSNSYKMLEQAVDCEMIQFLDFIKNSPEKIFTKCLSRQFASNAFTRYLCERRFNYNEPQLKKQAYNYDFIFNDISQCSAIDFLPFLTYLGVGRKYLKRIKDVSNELRNYVEQVLVNPRAEKLMETLSMEGEIDPETIDDRDVDSISLDLLLKYHLKHPEDFSREHLLFAIGDLVGGSSAIGNLLMRVLGHLAVDQQIQEELYQEAKATVIEDEAERISITHRKNMPLAEAAIMEALRVSSSPIVPHVPSVDTTIGGYFVPKGTMVLFNNYHLNVSAEHWEKPEKFYPRRFLAPFPENNNQKVRWQIKKPEIFFPFSVGRRSCLGYRLTNYITFVAMSNIVLKYKIVPLDPVETINQHLSVGILALRVDDCFRVKLIPRS